MRCDTCGWRTRKEKYDGDGECFCCFEGQMIGEGGNKMKFVVELDGDSLCIKREDFINLQETPAYFIKLSSKVYHSPFSLSSLINSVK